MAYPHRSLFKIKTRPLEGTGRITRGATLLVCLSANLSIQQPGIVSLYTPAIGSSANAEAATQTTDPDQLQSFRMFPWVAREGTSVISRRAEVSVYASASLSVSAVCILAATARLTFLLQSFYSIIFLIIRIFIDLSRWHTLFHPHNRQRCQVRHQHHHFYILLAKRVSTGEHHFNSS